MYCNRFFKTYYRMLIFPLYFQTIDHLCLKISLQSTSPLIFLSPATVQSVSIYIFHIHCIKMCKEHVRT